MAINKLYIRTYISYPDGLDEDFVSEVTNEFDFYYTPYTLVDELLIIAAAKCKSDISKEDRKYRFLLVFNERGYSLNPDIELTTLINYLGCDDRINLEFVVGIPGGAGIGEENGIWYFYHTNERGHMPHIHAKYQGEEISIDILTQTIKGKFKNKKKIKEAQEYVKRRQKYLLELYNDHTNGIFVDSIILNMPE